MVCDGLGNVIRVEQDVDVTEGCRKQAVHLILAYSTCTGKTRNIDKKRNFFASQSIGDVELSSVGFASWALISKSSIAWFTIHGIVPFSIIVRRAPPHRNKGTKEACYASICTVPATVMEIDMRAKTVTQAVVRVPDLEVELHQGFEPVVEQVRA